jgi:transposase, IS5 family
LRRLAADLDATVVDIQRLLAQTGLRLAGVRTIVDRLISLADPDARPIRKGKPQHPTQFGYTALVVEDERGVVADHQTHRGSPWDAGLLVGAVERVVAVTGPPPGTVVGDRGFGTAATTEPWPVWASPGSGPRLWPAVGRRCPGG